MNVKVNNNNVNNSAVHGKLPAGNQLLNSDYHY